MIFPQITFVTAIKSKDYIIFRVKKVGYFDQCSLVTQRQKSLFSNSQLELSFTPLAELSLFTVQFGEAKTKYVENMIYWILSVLHLNDLDMMHCQRYKKISENIQK